MDRDPAAPNGDISSDARRASTDNGMRQTDSSGGQWISSEDTLHGPMKDLTIQDVTTTGKASTTMTTTGSTKEKDELSILREIETLPQVFTVKYLGKRETRGLWGIKHTRGPVDDMVASARALKPGSFLPFLQLTVSVGGIDISEMPQNQNKNFEGGFYPIDILSYGVQDIVYTRVFAMIVVRGDGCDRAAAGSMLECHAFVCDARQNARRLTFALAAAFRLFSQRVKHRRKQKTGSPFAIDLRTPEEIRAELKGADAFDSEA